MYKRHFFQHQMAGFAWDQLAVRDVNLSTRPSSRRAIHTPCTSFIPRRLLDMVTTGDNQAIEIWDNLSRPVTRSASYSVYQHRESGSCADIPIEPLYPPRFAHGIITLMFASNRNALVILYRLEDVSVSVCFCV